MTESLMTELDAVNVMLGNIGELPISALTDDVMDAKVARTVLRQTSHELQANGWSFNTEFDTTLTPDGSGYITLPTDCIRVDNDPAWSDERDVVQKFVDGVQKLYDRTNHTFIFTKTVKVVITSLLSFDQLPQPARHYIAVKAARKFAIRHQGDQTTQQFTQADEQDAMLAFKQFDADTSDANILSDDWGVARILNRR